MHDVDADNLTAPSFNTPSTSAPPVNAAGITKKMSFFATALASGIFTLLMGVLVNVPVALAPGMGLNGYFASVVASGALDWQNALGAVFLSGIFYLFFTFTGLRLMLFKAVPHSLRAAITVGIGFFITMIGLKIGQITRVSILSMPPGESTLRDV